MNERGKSVGNRFDKSRKWGIRMKKFGMVVGLVLVVAGFSFGEGGVLPGSGTEGSPCLIEDRADFDVFCTNTSYWASGVYTRLETNLDLSDTNYVAAPVAGVFGGIFDGNDHVISNLTISVGQDIDNIGFFSSINGEVRSLGLLNIDIEGAGRNARIGGLCGSLGGTLFRCTVSGNISIAWAWSGEMVGGVCGYNGVGGNLTRCDSSVAIDAYESKQMGGLCGYNHKFGTILNCSASGDVSSTVGGSSEETGGLCGYNSGTIRFSRSSASVEGNKYVGGLCGRTGGGGSIVDCYADGAVAGYDQVGGLYGAIDVEAGLVRGCYSSAFVIGAHNVGGFCGSHSWGISHSCFWDIETSSQSTSEVGSGKTSAEMKTSSTFTALAWPRADFISGSRGWEYPEGGYPKLFWENSAAKVVPDVDGMTLPEAQASLLDSGFVTGAIVRINSWTIPSNTVAGLSASMGGYVTSSLPVDIYVSTGSSGNGSPESPYEIASQDDLEAINDVPRSNFVMTADIFLQPRGYTTAVIGHAFYEFDSFFIGVFNGNGYVVGNLEVDALGKDRDYLGLFGRLDGSISSVEIKNLTVQNVRICGGDQSSLMGGLCGYATNATLRNCHASGVLVGVNNGDNMGGVCGYLDNGIIEDCSFDGSVVGSDNLGGVCGYNNHGTLRDCTAMAAVTGTDTGWSAGDFHSEFIGGLCGYNNQGAILSCGATAEVLGDNRVGGLCGHNGYGTILESYASAKVVGGSKVGGLCGHISVGSHVTNCYSSGSVSGNDQVGGFVGECEWNLDIVDSYSSAAVDGATGTGGFCGAYGGASVDSCFWDIQASGQSNSVLGVGKTTAEMQAQTNFTDAGWDFVNESANGTNEVWAMGGYPVLSWQLDFLTLSVDSGSGDGSYTNGTVVPVSADIPSGHEFSEWTADPAGYTNNLAEVLSSSTTFTMPETNVTLTANFQAIPVPVECLVTNLVVAQRAGTKLVDISYDLLSDVTNAFPVSLTVSNGVSAVGVSSLSGDVGVGISTGATKSIIWDMGTDWSGNAAALTFTVIAGGGGGSAPAPSGMVEIPAGSNSGTNPLVDGESYDTIYPSNYFLTVDAFYMDPYEITKAQWDEVYSWATNNNYLFENSGMGEATNHPVHTVDWYDCVKWCNARSEKEGRDPCYTTNGIIYKAAQADPDCDFGANGYRLATHDEWEYAARGGLVGKRFSWGDMISHSNANYRGRGASYSLSSEFHPDYYEVGEEPFTSPVGSFSTNGFGLYDMVGNVYERAWTSNGANRANCSGSWGTDAPNSRVGKQGYAPPDEENIYSGFRVAVSMSPSASEPGNESDSVIVNVDARDYVLAVVSAHGTPVPGAGLHSNYCWRSSITCSVDAAVGEGGTNYTCAGWAGTGSIPLTGTTNNTGSVTLTNLNSSITWNWMADFWVSVVASGDGTVSAEPVWSSTNSFAGFIPAGSILDLEAVPDAGWLFTGWSGDLAGGYTASNTTLTVDASKSVTAHFSDDADGDGLKNTNEWAIGSNPRMSDTDGDGFDDAFEVGKGLSPTNDDSDVVGYISDHNEFFGLYSSNAVLDIAVGQILLEVLGGNASLQLQLQQSEDLQSWTNAGDAKEWVLPVDGAKKFYRIRAYE